MEVDILDVPGKKKLVAWIFYKGEQWAEVSQENEQLLLAIYPKEGGLAWDFQLDEAILALTEARNRLLGVNNENPENI